MQKRSLAEWKEMIKSGIASGALPRKGSDKVSIKFHFVDVTGNSAVAKFDFYLGSRRAYLDYQFLYKYEDGWKIVGKTLHAYETQ